jgi:hypothetical protein
MAGANATSYTVNNLPPDSRQFFMVTARNSAGSASTSWQLAQMPQAIPPSVPATLEVVANSPTEVAVSWSAANGADRYHVVHWTNTTGTRVVATVDAGVTNYVMTDAAPATRHWFRIEASNSSGKVSTAWQIAQTPSASIATAVAVNLDLAPLSEFSGDNSPLALRSASNITASRLAARQTWQREVHPAFSLTVTPAADNLDGRLDAFGEWQGEDSSLDWRGDDAEELLLDTLAESALAATHGEPDDAAIAQVWQNL